MLGSEHFFHLRYFLHRKSSNVFGMKSLLSKLKELKDSSISSLTSSRLTNPFSYDPYHLSPYAIFKIILLTCSGVLFIRIIGVTLCILAQRLVIEIATYNLPSEQKYGAVPYSRWRRRVIEWTIPAISRVELFFFGFLYIEYKGQWNKAAPIIVVNHHSILDGLFVQKCGVPMAVGKKDVANYPIVGKIMSGLQTVLIDRSTSSSRSEAIREITRRVHHGGFPPVLIFPEGTTTNSRTLVMFKRGAFVPGYPVQPVVISMTERFFNHGWVQEGPNEAILFIMSICQFYNRATVEFLPMYYPSLEEKRSPLLYANNVRLYMAKALNVPVTRHSYDDVALFIDAEQENVRTNVIVNELQEHFSFAKIDDIRKLLREFAKCDLNKDGLIDYSEFIRGMNLTDSEISRRVFDTFDYNSSGKIDFREFLIGVYLFIYKRREQEQKKYSKKDIDEIYQIFGVDANDEISNEEYEEVLTEANQRRLSSEAIENSAKEVISRRLSISEFTLLSAQNPDLLDILPSAIKEIVIRYSTL